MQRTCRGILAALLLAPGLAGAEALFGVDEALDEFVRIDSATGAATAIGPTGFPSLSSLASGAGGVLFATDSASRQLVRLNKRTGAAAAVGALGVGEVTGLAFAADGTLFGVEAGAGQLVTIDPTNGAATRVGPLGFALVTGLAFAADGTLFGVDSSVDQLLTIDPTSGAATVVGPTVVPGVTGLSFAEAGTLFGVSRTSDELLTIDTATGAAAGVGPLGGGDRWVGGLSFAVLGPPSSPSWKILLLISDVDFTFTDGQGQEHHLVSQMTVGEIDEAIEIADQFLAEDIPALNSGAMTPEWEIRVSQPLEPEPLGDCSPLGQGFWPTPLSAAPEIGPEFDSVFVIWNDRVHDSLSGETFHVGCHGGLTWHRGTGQAYASSALASTVPVAPEEKGNILKHEWGHSILGFFHAAGLSEVDLAFNHIDDSGTSPPRGTLDDPEIVHCPTGGEYAMDAGGTLIVGDSTVPNSVYHNDSGFTHDYYSGTVAYRSQPARCVGVSPSAWALGGPVTVPELPVNDFFADALPLHGFPGWVRGFNTFATSEPAEPAPPSAGGESVWWRWQAPARGYATFDTAGSDFDTVLTVYTGDTLGTLDQVVSNDDYMGRQSRVTFGASEGVDYRIQIDGAHEMGSISLSWSLCVGDVDGDGVTGGPDWIIVSGNFGANVPPGTMGDLTGDGLVGGADVIILSRDFGCAPSPTP